MSNVSGLRECWSDIVVNETKIVDGEEKGFGPGGSPTYSIWLYKGGARCNHKWFRKTYVRKKGSKSLGENISTTEARKRGFRPEANEQQVSVAPKDMPYKGYTKEYADKMGIEK